MHFSNFEQYPWYQTELWSLTSPTIYPRYRSDAWFYMAPSVCPWVGQQWGGLAWESKVSSPGCFQFDTAYCNLRRSPLRNCRVRLACSHLCGLVLVDDGKETIPLWAAPSLGRWGVRKPTENESVRKAVSSVPPRFQLQSWLDSLPWLFSVTDCDLKV